MTIYSAMSCNSTALSLILSPPSLFLSLFSNVNVAVQISPSLPLSPVHI